ncbi:MAG: hypothetical protein IIZ78_00715 [Clostridiales bacterium]|nr:hypothetical protein [Clostridiales bacterium]
MKLRNKKTGEIKNVNHNKVLIHFNDGQTECINSLAELNEEWEDYEEPRFYWYVGFDGRVREAPTKSLKYYEKEFGNYFETREEAEKAVEKLKAWKRLKDKGFKFGCWYGGSRDISFYISQEKLDKETAKDLDLLFGGEE